MFYDLSMSTERDDRHFHEQANPDQRRDQTNDSEAEQLPITLEDELLEISLDLGFIEPESLKTLRESIQPGMTQESTFQIIAEYQRQARDLTPGESDPLEGNVVLGVNIAGAAVILRSGRHEDAREELQTIIMAAENMNQPDVADYLADILHEI